MLLLMLSHRDTHNRYDDKATHPSQGFAVTSAIIPGPGAGDIRYYGPPRIGMLRIRGRAIPELQPGIMAKRQQVLRRPDSEHEHSDA